MSSYSLKKLNAGFTLIELLVVVGIIGILAAVGVVAYSGYVTSSKVKSAENIIQQMALAQTEYYSDKGNYYTQDDGCTPDSSNTSKISGSDALDVPVPDNIDFVFCVQKKNTINYEIIAESTVIFNSDTKEKCEIKFDNISNKPKKTSAEDCES